jgi:hypothetical protein
MSIGDKMPEKVIKRIESGERTITYYKDYSEVYFPDNSEYENYGDLNGTILKYRIVHLSDEHFVEVAYEPEKDMGLPEDMDCFTIFLQRATDKRKGDSYYWLGTLTPPLTDQEIKDSVLNHYLCELEEVNKDMSFFYDFIRKHDLENEFEVELLRYFYNNKPNISIITKD